MILLTMDTEHSHFQAAGENLRQAQTALNLALQYHGEQYGLARGWWRGHYDVNRLEIMPGECFRDGQLLYRDVRKER